jgi:elongation factor P
MGSTAGFRKGMAIRLDKGLYVVVDFLHVKPGKGGAFVRTKLKDARTEAVIDRTFRAGEQIDEVRLDRRPVQFLYRDDRDYVFMDEESYEQIPLDSEVLGDTVKYLKEELRVQLVVAGDEHLGIELPTSVELAVVTTDPGVKGDTASGGSKPATLETGLVIQVPLFLAAGDVVRVDTRTGQYIERA